jgi:chromosome segregation ATPase
MERIKKMELSLDELIPKFQGRLELIREDLKSLIKDIDDLKTLIGDSRRKSNDYTREISDLSNDLQGFRDEIVQIEKEISRSQSMTDSVNLETQELNSELMAGRNRLGTLEGERSALQSTLSELEREEAGLQEIYDQFRPKFEKEVASINEQYASLKKKHDSLGHRFEAMRILCSEGYLATPEVNIVKYLAMKPSATSSVTEMRSALGVDPTALSTVLRGLATRQVLELDESSGNVTIRAKIDLFNMER